MKKRLNIIYLMVALIFGAVSCELPDNVDPKGASEVPASALFTNAQAEFMNHVNDCSVNRNISRFFAQYWTETTYFDEARYNLSDRSIPDAYWRVFYRDILMDLKEARRLVNEWEPTDAGNIAKKANQLALIDVIEVYSFQVLVDAFGDIPYADALKEIDVIKPKYDDAAGIYSAILTQLTNAINSMDVSAGSFGTADLLFGGDVASWRTFASSLKLRMAMRLADVNPSVAQTAVSEAIASGVYNSIGSGAIFNYTTTVPHVNAIYEGFTIDGRKDFLPTSQIIEPMKAMNDPRLSLLFSMVDTSTVAGTHPPVYLGAEYGKDGAQTYSNFSNFAPAFYEADFPAVLIDYAEVSFLLAEAVERGMAVSGTAEEHYNNAIVSNIVSWGGSVIDANAYIAQPEVAYSTATGAWRQKIGEQKWFALYNRGVEAWAEWRKLDFPVLPAPEGLTYDDIPKRMPYPYVEDQINKDNKDAAGTAIGGDDVSTKLFWDIN